ncbi:histidine kinase [Sphingomonas sp. GlSt437]|uniref:histidine kinase n=1 Tax=Sphingomonas sp. GlSt437 TaxID=3389970 RepID=UPI003A880E44
MRKLVSIVALAASGLIAGSANAQSFGIYIGNDGGYNWQYHDYDDDGVVRSVCSGARAHALEARLRHEVDENEIDDDDAARIHNVIDRLEGRQRHECAEGDRRSIYEIAQRYNGIGQWIDREAHGDERRW